jgi:hypothetical protein
VAARTAASRCRGAPKTSSILSGTGGNRVTGPASTVSSGPSSIERAAEHSGSGSASAAAAAAARGAPGSGGGVASATR